jgi:superfamily II DNA or RNA helicase
MNNIRVNQLEALLYFKKHYYEENQTRGLLSMCCGSGKTRTFYEIMKYCMFEKNENLIIYATSRIILVENIIQDIIEYLFVEQQQKVCIMIKVSQFNINNIKVHLVKKYKCDGNKFMKYFNNNIKIVILDKHISDIVINKIHRNEKILMVSTYQSLLNIYDDFKSNNYSTIMPDLVCCDESHNLVSDINKKTNIIIHEESSGWNEIHKKILFMTATPLKIITNNSNSYSMSNVNIFGKCFYEYSFSRGILDKYIVDFNVIYFDDVNEISNMYNHYANNLNDYAKQDLYFKIISKYLLKTIDIYNLKRTIVYISNQTKAKELCKLLHNVKYIISEQSHTDKICILNWFKTSNEHDAFKILVSVDIFNEGVDIPICDSIFFAEARKSESRIVQNIGRCLRNYSCNNYTKKIAYVILPVGPDNENFKTIQTICGMLKLKKDTTDCALYNKISCGKTKEFRNDKEDCGYNKNSNTINQEMLVKTDTLNDITKQKNDEISELIVNSYAISDNNTIKCDTSENINEPIICRDYNMLKLSIRENNIQNLTELKSFITTQDYPHQIFEDTWISYGDLLFDKTYTYEESVKFINTLDLTDITTSTTFTTYYEYILINAFQQNNTKISINEFIKLPNDPTKYYSQKWTNWSNYLSIPLKENEQEPSKNNKKKEASLTSKCLENSHNIFKNIKNNCSYPFNIIKTDISKFVNYIKNYYELKNITFNNIFIVYHNNQSSCLELHYKSMCIIRIKQNYIVYYYPSNFGSVDGIIINHNKTRELTIKSEDMRIVLNNIFKDLNNELYESINISVDKY